MQESYAIREWCVGLVVSKTPSDANQPVQEIIDEAKKLEHYILNVEDKVRD